MHVFNPITDLHPHQLSNVLEPTATQRATAGRVVGRRQDSPTAGAAEASATSSAGLSNSHISPNTSTASLSPYLKYRENGSIGVANVGKASGKFTIYPEGTLFRIRRSPAVVIRSSLAAIGGGRRSYVSGFSGNSRRRLMYLLGTLKKAQVPTFITLTYPSIWPDPTACKKHLDTFTKRLFRRCPNACFIWKLEFQKRGAPHFHLMVWGLDQSPGFRSWLSEAWYKIVGSGDYKHLLAGTRVEHIRSWSGVMSYAAKYMSKDVQLEDEWGRPGRFWGVRGDDRMPWAGQLEGELTYNEANLLMRFACRYLGDRGKRQRRRSGTTLFVENPIRWLDLLDALPSMAL